jgi:hypothetical protein
VAGESFTVAEDSAAVDYDVLANDAPSQSGDTLTVTNVTATSGTATITNNGTRVRYVPNLNFNGTDRVIYTVRSSNGGTAIGTMTMTVTSVNDAPTAVNDTLTVLSTPNQNVDVLKNDTNVDSGETLTITAVTQPAAGLGTVSIAAGGKSLIYTAPSSSFTGDVDFQYTLGDGAGQTSNASVKLTVVNFTPRDVGVRHEGNVQGVAIQVTQTSGPNANPGAMAASYELNLAKVNDVGPGTYLFTVPTLPFFVAKDTKAEVVSNFSDGDNLGTKLNVGTRDPNFMDLRDFTSKNLRKGLTVAVQPNQSALWYNGVKDWRSFSNVQVNLNQAATQLTIRTVDAAKVTRQATLPTSDPRVVLRGKQGDNHLFRIQAAPSDLTFTTVTNASTQSASSTTAEGEGRPSLQERRQALNPQNVDSAMATSPVDMDHVINQVAQGTARNVTLSSFRSRR